MGPPEEVAAVLWRTTAKQERAERAVKDTKGETRLQMQALGPKAVAVVLGRQPQMQLLEMELTAEPDWIIIQTSELLTAHRVGLPAAVEPEELVKVVPAGKAVEEIQVWRALQTQAGAVEGMRLAVRGLSL
jgi:hypothetical protein